MKRLRLALLAIVLALQSTASHAQTLRQLTRSGATLGDSSLTFTSDTVSSTTTFATRAASIAQLRKALSKFAFDSLVVGSGPIRANGATILTSNLTYGGVTLNNAVTGTGNMVLSASPTFTGTITGATVNWSGLATFNSGATIASGQTLTVTGATITGLTAASVGAGTFPSGAFVFAGAVSGITTLAGTGAVSGFTTAAFSSTISSSSASGFGAQLQLGNNSPQIAMYYTGTTAAVAIGAVTTGGNFVAGSTAGDAVFRHDAGKLLFARSTSNIDGYFDAAGLLTLNAGLTVSAGTTAVQALTATTIAGTTGTFSEAITAADTLLGLGYHSRARSVSSLNVPSGTANTAVLGTSAGSHGILLLECQKHGDISFRGSGAYWVVFSPASGFGGITRIGTGDVNGPSGAWPATVIVAANYTVSATVSSGGTTDCFFHWYGGDWG